jgi:hypothetical protein
MVGGLFQKKQTCLMGPAPNLEPGTSSTVGPGRQSKLVPLGVFNLAMFGSY